MLTENRRGELLKAHSNVIGKCVLAGHGNETILHDRVPFDRGTRRHRFLTGYQEWIVQLTDQNHLMVISEFAQLCISIIQSFDHMHLSPMAQNGWGIKGYRGGLLKAMGHRKFIPMIIDEVVTSIQNGCEDISRGIT